MRVLMFGWEFPPFNSGGLGTACEGLTRGLSNNDVEVTFVMPYAPDELTLKHIRMINASKAYGNIKNIKIKKVDSLLVPYSSSESYDERLRMAKLFQGNANYGGNIYEEARRFAERAKIIAAAEDFDVIHCHDWMTYEAGINAKAVSGKPLVCHIHATEFDRTGGNNNEYIYAIERRGFHAADKVIAVSNYTKGKVTYHYGVPAEKVEVVHNGIDVPNYHIHPHELELKNHFKTVLFLGRITIQKGPDWFLYAAKKVLEVDPDVRFIFVGSGDMERFIIEKAADLGIAKNVLFGGFLRDRDAAKAYRLADLYVMPSISEPFGLTPLEAIKNGTPVIISKQSGVSEIIENCIKVDFWDTDLMAKKILEVLHDPHLKKHLAEKSGEEVSRINWDGPAKKCKSIYQSLIQGEASW